MLSSVLKLRQVGKLATFEPAKPIVRSIIPGPQSVSLLNQYQGLSQEFRSVRFFVDYESSFGNYIADADGNQILDMSGQDSSLPIGYNNPYLLSYIKESNIKYNLMHRTACSMFPSEEWPLSIKNNLMPAAPAGLTEIFNSCGCSFGAVENAIKTASIWFYSNKFGSKYTDEQLNTSASATLPGTPNFSLLTLKGGFHSNFTSFASNKAQYVPTLNFEEAPFPKLKYPYDNAEEENKALEATRLMFRSNSNIFAMLIEPILQKGNYYASKTYYQELQKIVKEAGAAFIIDESFVGLGGSGKLWAHEHWDLQPDIMVYGGRTQASGYFMKPQFRPPYPGQIMGTWCGDPTRVQLFGGIRSIINNQDLVQKARTTGDYIMQNLHQLFASQSKISNLRGKGLHIAFDAQSKQVAWKLCKELLEHGIHVNVVEDKIIQLSPSLVFEKKHADIFLEAIEECLKTN